MRPFTTDEIRSAFLDFFATRGHTVVRSSSLVPQNDPTLLFTNAGMNQFKDVFTGREKRDYTRATSSQKCVRAGGKHNDLENVGFTARHHTFFEMLGNFSFGDYFKPDAIAFAWEFITQTLGVDPDRVSITLFEGDDAVPADEEADALWRAQGVRPERIFRLGRRDNFWQMGDTGPCGPCTELHVYRGPLETRDEIDEHARAFFSGALGDTDDWMEIWNLVFMQFDRSADGTLTPLPRPSVDTGAGLERLASVVQNAKTNYDTDLMKGICQEVARIADKTYPSNADDDASMRVIADHARATSFLVSDGVMPSNEGRGYVLRRIMRRAIRHGKRLGIEALFFDRACAHVVSVMGDAYPELRESASFLREVVRAEEESFRHTLNRGLTLLDEEIALLETSGKKTLSGPSVFKLYDTFGFPSDLTRVIANERGYDIDEAGFEEEMNKQRARSTFGGSGEARVNDLYKKLEGQLPATVFLGYEHESATARVLKLVRDGQEVEHVTAPAKVEFIFDRTPFYAESGGQTADHGQMHWPTGVKGRVLDVQKPAGNLFVHSVELTEGSVQVGSEVELDVDQNRRKSLRANHSATHLLHHVLREFLGDHVKQKGSIVAVDYLRFDYAHFAGLDAKQLREIERRVNALVRDNASATTDELTIDEAKSRGAIAFFGEKYGESVRMLSIGPSVELCGGTHVSRTGDIGFFKIESESAIASGVRRIVATTGADAIALVHDEEKALASAAATLKSSPKDLPTKAEAAMSRIKELEKELDGLRKAQASAQSGDLANQAQDVGGIKVLALRSPESDPKAMRDLADKLRDKMGDHGGKAVIVLGAESDGKAMVLVAVTKALCATLGARAILDELSKTLGGRGGGKPEMAQAGGGDPAKLDEALALVSSFVQTRA